MIRIVPYMQSAYIMEILHGVATEVLNCLKHYRVDNRNGIMLNRSVSVGIRGVLLVFVDNRGNFGTTDICEIILVYQMNDYVQRLMVAGLLLELLWYYSLKK